MIGLVLQKRYTHTRNFHTYPCPETHATLGFIFPRAGRLGTLRLLVAPCCSPGCEIRSHTCWWFSVDDQSLADWAPGLCCNWSHWNGPFSCYRTELVRAFYRSWRRVRLGPIGTRGLLLQSICRFNIRPGADPCVRYGHGTVSFLLRLSTQVPRQTHPCRPRRKTAHTHTKTPHTHEVFQVILLGHSRGLVTSNITRVRVTHFPVVFIFFSVMFCGRGFRG